MADDDRLIPPLLDYPLVSNERITLPWSTFLLGLYRVSGGSVVPIDSPVIIRVVPVDRLAAYDAVTGAFLGYIALEDQPGGPEQVVAPLGSPRVYSAISDGVLVVFAAQVELRRNAGPWFKVTLQGGAVPMKPGDDARITWYTAQAPEITWFPTWLL